MEKRKIRIGSLVDVCGLCKWSVAHSCSLHSCGEAARKAEEYYRKERGRIRMEEYKGSPDSSRYGGTVMEALHGVLGVSVDADKESIRKEYSLDEILDAVLVYEGILGYSGKLVRIIEKIFGVDLLKKDV